MTYFLRNGNSYRITDEANLDLHTKLPVSNYIIKQDPFGNLFLEKINSFTEPKKIYGDTIRHANRIMNTFLDRPNSTGVLLAGEKGSGKTLLSKKLSMLAATHDMPTIVINSAWTGDAFNQLIQDISQPCVVLLDEFEKMYDQEDQESILTLLDGVFPSKKLFVLTCNDKWRIDNHMRNRPGRIFYMLDFKGLDGAFIEEYCEDNLKSTQHIDTICKISTMFDEFNFDMLKALVEEMNRYGETPQEAMKMLNAKPEFGDRLTYTVQLVIDNKVVPIEDIDDETWTGNPLNDQIRIGYKEWNKDHTDYDWEHQIFKPQDLKKVDGKAGSFLFADSEASLILTRYSPKTFNYFGAF